VPAEPASRLDGIRTLLVQYSPGLPLMVLPVM
jgi:hypothetical protein